MAKIGIVCLDLSVTGGAEQVAVNLSNALVKKNEVHLISIYPGNGKIAYSLDAAIQYTTILEKEERLRHTIQHFRKPFRNYVKEHHIELVLLIGDYPGVIALFARRGLTCKFVFCEHGALMNQWNEKDIRLIRCYNAKRADKVVTLTKSSRDSYIEKFRLKQKKVTYIYNWIDTSVMEKTSPYDVSTHKILSVGRFGTEKGQDLLLQVARQVLPKHPDWIWDVYGDGETFEKIAEDIAIAGLGNQLVLKGNDPDVQSKYGSYAFFVLTSYREGLPLVLLEAKANHLPMVSFDIMTGPREIIDGDGILIQPYDTKKMSDEILKLMENDDLRQELSEKTTNSIDNFSQTIILKQWQNLINEFITIH